MSGGKERIDMKFSVFMLAANCAAVLGAAEFAFAPNVQPQPKQIQVETNTLVRVDRDLTITVACADGSGKAAVCWAEDRFEEWFRFTKTGWIFTSVNAPRVVATEYCPFSTFSRKILRPVLWRRWVRILRAIHCCGPMRR